MTPNRLTARASLTDLFGIDLRTLALFRFALGLVIFWNLARGFGDLSAFWTDWGVMPRSWIIEADSAARISLYYLNGSAAFTGTLLALQCVLALMFALGWHTRLATIASFVLWGSLMNRNPLLLIGGDLLVACLLFWAMFLPLAARYSVDAALAHNAPPKDPRHLSWASAGLLIQVMSVYFFSAFLKYGIEWAPNYTAVYYALSLDRYATPLGLWLLQFPGLLKALSFFVYWLEALGPVLMFTPILLKPLRFGLMLLFMAMHLGFILCLEVGHFPYVSLCSLSVFLGGWFWDRAWARQQRRHPGVARIYYDRDCGFCLKSCLLFQQFLVLPAAQIAPAQDTPRARTLLEVNNSWVVIDADDRAYLKWPALVVLLKRSPVARWLWWLLKWPQLEKAGNAVYDFVARHRGAFSRVTALLLPRRAVDWEIGRHWQRLAAVFIVLVLVWNLATLEKALRRHIGHQPPLEQAANRVFDLLSPLLRSLRIDQLWNMFAPYPLKEDGWFVIPARLADGSEIDLLQPDRGPPAYDKPRHYSQTHENIRWHTYRGRLWEAEYAPHRLYYGKYLCREWNRDKRAGAAAHSRRLMSFKLVYMLERTPPPGYTASVEQNVISRHECFPEETQGQTKR